MESMFRMNADGRLAAKGSNYKCTGRYRGTEGAPGFAFGTAEGPIGESRYNCTSFTSKIASMVNNASITAAETAAST
jgi:hypothetical protein